MAPPLSQPDWKEHFVDVRISKLIHNYNKTYNLKVNNRKAFGLGISSFRLDIHNIRLQNIHHNSVKYNY